MKWKSAVRNFTNSILHITFPDVCLICNQNLYGMSKHICGRCLEQPSSVMDHVEFYGEDLLICPHPILFQWSAWKFDKHSLLQELLHQLKYGGKPGLGYDLGVYCGKQAQQAYEMGSCNLSLLQNPLLVPVPLHRRKQRKRGYNQAYEIAKGFSEALKIELLPFEIVRRRTFTKTQTGLNAAERKKNLHNVFEIVHQDSFKDRDIIIVDDVFTTGATTFELAKLFASHGVQAIAILTLAEA